MEPQGTIGSEIYSTLANSQNLTIQPADGRGLLTSFDALKGFGFDPKLVCREVRDFYEHTSHYRLKA